jgi:hypothetical protein
MVSSVGSQNQFAQLQSALRTKKAKNEPAARVNNHSNVAMLEEKNESQAEEAKETPATKAAEALSALDRQETTQRQAVLVKNTSNPLFAARAYQQSL